MENPSSNIHEEYKRKTRISAGGLQSIIRNSDLMNPLKYGTIAIQFLLHRVSRWTIAPILLITALVSSFFVWQNGPLFQSIFILQALFYLLGFLGWYYKENKIESRILNIPFYFLFMHYCVIIGWFRYLQGNQKAAWQKAIRLNYN